MSYSASIIDYPRAGLDESIWQIDRDTLQLQPNIKDEIADIIGSFLDDLDLSEDSIIDVYIYGSILTNQYNSKTDVDARILLDPKIVRERYPGVSGDDLYDLATDTIHEVMLGDTEHPFNATVVIEGDTTELGQSPLGRSERDPVYSIKEEGVIHEGDGYDESFDPDVEFMEERSDIIAIMTKLDALAQDAKTNTIDIELLKEAVGNVDNPDILTEKIEDRLNELNFTIEKMVHEYSSIKEERSTSYKDGPKEDRHKAPGNIRFKFLEKYRYMDMLKKLKKIFKGGVGTSEVDDIAKALNVKAQVPAGPAAPTSIDIGRIDEGGMLNQIQTQGATCPHCNHVNPMTANSSNKIMCESCGKHFEAEGGLSINTGPSLPDSSHPYESDFKIYNQTTPPQITEDMIRLLRDVGVSDEVITTFEKKLNGEPLTDEETRVNLLQQPDQSNTAPVAPNAPNAPTAPNAPNALTPGVQNVLKPGITMNKMQAPTAKTGHVWSEPDFLEFIKLGEEFRRADADEYGVILEEMSEPEKGSYRVQWYTSSSPVGHTVHQTFEKAAEQLYYALGPNIAEANGSMDVFALSDEWARALTWLSEVEDEDLGGWLSESIDDLKIGHLLFGAILMENLIEKLDKIKADSTGGTGGTFGEPPGKNPGDDPYSSGGGALAEYGTEGEPDAKDKKKKRKEPDDDMIWEIVTVLEGMDIAPFLEDDYLLEELLAAFPMLGEASTKIDAIVALNQEPPEGTGQYRAPINPDYDTEPKLQRNKRKHMKSSPGKAKIEETGEAVGIDWFDKYKTANNDLKELIVDWLIDHPDPDDDAVHALAEELEMEPDELEEVIYELATEHADEDDNEDEDGKEKSDGPVDLDEESVRAIGEEIGIDWDEVNFDPKQFLMGINVEFEHGTKTPETNVTDDDIIATAKITWAHLKEIDDYYYRLKKMEDGAKNKTDNKKPDDEETDDEEPAEGSSGGGVGGFNDGSPSSKTAAAYMTLCPNCNTIQKAPMEGEGIPCPNCNKALLNSLETSDPERYREHTQQTDQETERLHTRRLQERGALHTGSRVDRKITKQINQDLREAGMDGNGRFETAGMAYTVAIDILDSYELLPSVDISSELGDSDILMEEFQNKGTKHIELVTPDGEPVENTQLVFQYYQFLETGQYEILAMLS